MEKGLNKFIFPLDNNITKRNFLYYSCSSPKKKVNFTSCFSYKILYITLNNKANCAYVKLLWKEKKISQAIITHTLTRWKLIKHHIYSIIYKVIFSRLLEHSLIYHIKVFCWLFFMLFVNINILVYDIYPFILQSDKL